VPHSSSYVWRYGVQCHRVDGRLGESCFCQSVVASLVPSKGGFEGSGLGASCLVVVRESARGLS
jgi:hypothetical protein